MSLTHFIYIRVGLEITVVNGFGGKEHERYDPHLVIKKAPILTANEAFYKVVMPSGLYRQLVPQEIGVIEDLTPLLCHTWIGFEDNVTKYVNDMRNRVLGVVLAEKARVSQMEAAFVGLQATPVPNPTE